MMINKRLIGTVRGSRRYVAGNVALQWCALAANIAMIGAVCRLLNRLYLETAGTEDLLFTAAVALAAVIYAGAALLLGAVDREELLALPGGEKLARLLRLK